MNIKVVITEKIKDKFSLEAIKEYDKRLTRYCKIKLIEAKNENHIKKEIGDKFFIILVNTKGILITSENLAEKLSGLALSGISDVIFLFFDGEIPDYLKERVDFHLALSNMDIDINIKTVMIYEQIYRAYRIKNNEPYHK